VVDFREKSGLECIALGVDKTLYRIRQKYQEYGIKQDPYVFIKSDKGTYGMGIMTASSGQEVLEMGKKIRNKMTSIKGGAENSAVIIQEGVPTIDVVDGYPAEPMIYLIGAEPVGCMYRLNTLKDSRGNLNASGMQFASMKESKAQDAPCKAVGLVARLASYASAWECYSESYAI
jgi:glutamate--cysteine ligase